MLPVASRRSYGHALGVGEGLAPVCAGQPVLSGECSKAHAQPSPAQPWELLSLKGPGQW